KTRRAQDRQGSGGGSQGPAKGNPVLEVGRGPGVGRACGRSLSWSFVHEGVEGQKQRGGGPAGRFRNECSRWETGKRGPSGSFHGQCNSGFPGKGTNTAR